jgi:hypothetical protein
MAATLICLSHSRFKVLRAILAKSVITSFGAITARAHFAIGLATLLLHTSLERGGRLDAGLIRTKQNLLRALFRHGGAAEVWTITTGFHRVERFAERRHAGRRGWNS